MLVTKYAVTDEIWKDGLRPDEDVSIRQRSSPYINTELFLDFIEGTFIPCVNAIRRELNMEKETAVLMLDLCKAHCSEKVLQILGENNIIVYAFPSHTTNIFQPCDLSLFGIFKQIEDAMSHETEGKNINEYIKRILKAYKSAATSFNIRSSFQLAGLSILTKSKKYKLEYHPEILKKNNDFIELWNINIKIDDLSKRRLSQKFEVLNEKYLPKDCVIYINEMSQKQEENILKGLKK